MKAHDLMNAVTSVLTDTMNDYSPTAYFASLALMYQHADLGGVNPEALAYSFSAVVSMLDIAVIQNQHALIFEIIAKHMLNPSVLSHHIGKYGVISLQFLLHSKTEAQWNNPADVETDQAFTMLLNSLIDRRDKVAKQA